MLFNDKKQIHEKEIKKLMIEDSIPSSRICLLLIMVMELYFIITWFIYDHSFTDFSKLRYLIAYAVLFFFAVTSYILLKIFTKDKVNGYKKIGVIQAIGTIAILLWSVVITIFDGDHHTEFSYIIYATIVVLLPVVVYINTFLLNLTYIFCDIALIIFTVIIKPDNFISTILNFIVFAIVSLFASNLYGQTKYTSIRRAVELQYIVGRDNLTGLYNRHKLNEISPDILRSNCIEKTELSCVMMDVDNFKQINDHFGHMAGDMVLMHIAECLLQEKNDDCLVFRYGGEEFLILLSNYSSQQACNVVERIQNRLKRGIPNFHEPVTLSFGIYTAVPEADDNIENYYAIADDMLYISKKNGKNQYTATGKR